VPPQPFSPSWPNLCWDIFCRVIDNHGDLGVCWRLSADLAQRGQRVRLWVDDASALSWMAPQGCAGVELLPWPNEAGAYANCADVVIEAFGCELPETIQAQIATASASRIAASQPPVQWINLEYLSAEGYVQRQHGLPSPVMSGPAKGCTKWFFYPGFTEGTGGLLREADLLKRQHPFDAHAWRAQHAPHLPAGGRLISLFCYEPPGLPAWLAQLKGALYQLLVTPGRASAAVRAALAQMPTHEANRVHWHALPHTDQTGFDHMLWACDLNFVRGEDSLARALWAGRPFVWHIYPQDDQAHHAKLNAFLDWLDAPQSLRQFHVVWNGIEGGELPSLTSEIWQDWQTTAESARQKLLQHASLTDQLLGFVALKRS